MSNEVEVYERLMQIGEAQKFSTVFGANSEQAQKIAEHKAWLQNIRHERPNTAHHFRVGVYIRYFNQTKHENYLAYHIQDFKDTLSLCPNWELVDFYIDEGASPPNMENISKKYRLSYKETILTYTLKSTHPLTEMCKLRCKTLF